MELFSEEKGQEEEGKGFNHKKILNNIWIKEKNQLSSNV